MGFIYTLGISTFSKNTVQKDSYHFDLKSFLQDSLKTYDKKIELIVLDDMALVRIGGKKATDTKFTLPKDIEFFSYWSNGKQREYFKPYFDSDGYFKDVLFRYVVVPHKYSTKCIIKKEDKYHIQSNYFKDESVFDELYTAKDYLLQTDIKNGAEVADE